MQIGNQVSGRLALEIRIWVAMIRNANLERSMQQHDKTHQVINLMVFPF